MEKQTVSEIAANLFQQGLSRLGSKEEGFFLMPDQDAMELQQNGQNIFRFSSPIKMGTVLNYIRRLAARSALENLPEEIHIGPYVFEPRKSRLVADMETLQLTDKERDILAALWRAPDHALDRDALLKMVWAYADGVETHTLETHIYRLRQKIEEDPGDPLWLVNHDGMYRLNA